MTDLMDTLRPADPPAAKGARALHPLDGDRVHAAAKPAGPSVDYKAMALKNRAAAVRYALFDNPDGLDYDELAKLTGILRSKVTTDVGAMVGRGDAEARNLPNDRRVFVFTGDPMRLGPRVQDPPEPSNAADRKPADRSTPATDRASDSAATHQPAAPQASATARTDALTPPLGAGGPARAADHEPEAPQSPEPARAGADPMSAALSADASAIRFPPIVVRDDSAHALAVELVCIAAKNAIAEVRASFGRGDLRQTWPELADAIANFERADRIYVSTKGRA